MPIEIPAIRDVAFITSLHISRKERIVTTGLSIRTQDGATTPVESKLKLLSISI
jgi:hypothetical protein